MRKAILILTILICLSFLVLPKASSAAQLFVPDPIENRVSEDCQLHGNCALDEFINYIIYAVKFVLPIIGGLALFMFVIGGVFWIISAGSSERVEKGKKIMVGAIIGIVIVLSAWLLIIILEDVLGVEEWAKPVEIREDS